MTLEVAGSTELSGDTLDVRVDLTNRGSSAAVPVAVEGELFGSHDQAKLEQGIAAGATRSVLLRFPLAEPKPGLHALLLLLDYGAPGTADAASQRAYLLLSLGAAAREAVKVDVPEAAVTFIDHVKVALASADGAAHRVAVTLATPRNLRADPDPVQVDVPAHGTVWTRVRVFRGAAPRGTIQGVLVVASTVDDPVVHTTVKAGLVRVRSDPSWMPVLRPVLVTVAALLLLGAVWRELASPDSEPTDEPPVASPAAPDDPRA